MSLSSLGAVAGGTDDGELQAIRCFFYRKMAGLPTVLKLL
jgi:hypothetical protein